MIDHIIQRPLGVGVIKTYITNHFAIYVGMIIKKSQSIRSQRFIRGRQFRRDDDGENSI